MKEYSGTWTMGEYYKNLFNGIREFINTEHKTNEANTKQRATKPPLGIMSLRLHNEKRKTELESAINRYNMARLPIPSEWIDELEKIGE